MDSYGMTAEDGRHVVLDDDKDSRVGDFDDDWRQSDFDDDGPSSNKTESAACCSSASDTDFYYEDRTDFHDVHKTVVEIRSEDNADDGTFVREEEFQDSLVTVQDRRLWNTEEIPTKHRHVLSESCHVKVQNLRYNM